MQTITIEQIRSIYASHGAEMSESELLESLGQCNEQSGVIYNDIFGNPCPVRYAEDWAHFFAKQDADYQHSDALATAKFHCDAYGA